MTSSVPGSPTIAAWIGHVVFVTLIVSGWDRLGRKRGAIFILLWLIGLVGLGGPLFAPYVAVLDVALVLLIFKGDVTLW